MDSQLVFALLAVVVLSGVVYAGSKGAPWVPTRKSELENLFNNLEFPEQAIVYDFGCGDGRVVFHCAKKDKVKRSVGYELAWPLYLFCLIKKLFIAKKVAIKTSFKFANFLTAKINDADVVFCFLMPKTMKKIFPIIQSQLKSGAKLVSAVFPIEGVTPTKVIRKTNKNCLYYVYVK